MKKGNETRTFVRKKSVTIYEREKKIMGTYYVMPIKK